MNRNLFRCGTAMGLLVSALLYAGGCARVGQQFDQTKVPGLEIGKMHDTDYRGVFGEPQNVTRESGNDGAFETATYTYAHANLSSARARQLILEFRNGVLNGFNYVSSFDEDRTSANGAAAASIQRTVSTKDDVLRLMGPPSGKARTPTHMEGFVRADKPGVFEIWAWVAFDVVHTFGDNKSPGSNVIVVGFDPLGTVSEVIIQQQNIPTTQQSGPTTNPSDQPAQPSGVPGN